MGPQNGGQMRGDGLGNVKATVGLFREAANLLDTEIKALSEIIKNSYDADAKTVILNLKDAFKPKAQNPQILIRDDGHGMSLDDFNKKWFIVGRSANKEEPFSPEGRVRQGGKGLGRLGAWKIGERVTVYSSKRGHAPLGVCIDISELSNSKLFDEIIPVKVPGAESYFPNGEYGTVIRIEKFNRRLAGAASFCQNMARSILLLQNPFDELTDFKINPLYPRDIIGEMANFNLQQLAEQGLYHADLEIEGNVIQGTFKDNNKYSGRENKTRDFYQTIPEHDGVNLRSIKVKIRAFAGDSNMYRYTRILPGNNQPLARSKFEELTGFRLYKDGIRVTPYGEPGNDWLGLDDVRYAGDSIFQNRRLIAMANYSVNLNPGLREVAARNGLIKNKEYDALVGLLHLAVKELRRWANPIPNSLPKRFTAPELHYPRLDIKPGERFSSASPTNVGGKLEKLDVSCISVSDVKINKKSGVLSGTGPNSAGTYQVTVSASNEHGSSESVFILHVKEPATDIPPESDRDVQPLPQVPVTDPKPNVSTTKNKLSFHHSSLLGVVTDIVDVSKKQELEQILRELHDFINDL